MSEKVHLLFHLMTSIAVILVGVALIIYMLKH